MTITSKFYGEKRVWFCGKKSCTHSTRATARACAKWQREKAEKKTAGTNAEFVRANRKFQDACLLAGIAPTARQASKWRMGKGLPFRFKGFANDDQTYSVFNETGENQELTLLQMARQRNVGSPIFWQGKINAICLGI